MKKYIEDSNIEDLTDTAKDRGIYGEAARRVLSRLPFSVGRGRNKRNRKAPTRLKLKCPACKAWNNQKFNAGFNGKGAKLIECGECGKIYS